MTWKARGLLKYCLNSDSKIVFGHNNLRVDNIILAKFEDKCTSGEKQKVEKGKEAVVDTKPQEDVCLNVQFQN